MRYALISDIHGNLEALLAVLGDIQTRSIDQIVCLGDIVGYYPDPEICVNLIQQNSIVCVAGNHDYAAVDKIKTQNFTQYAFEAMEWTKKQLSEESKKFLLSLPLQLELDGMLLTHSSPAMPEKFSYIFPASEKSVAAAFTAMKEKLNFIGHSHWPFIVTKRGTTFVRITSESIALQPDLSYLVNVGSVGQPRNGDPRSSYVVYDSKALHLSFNHVTYDFSVTQQKVLQSNLPRFLAERLAKGK